MKHLLPLTFATLFLLFSCTSKPEAPQELEVTWFIPIRYNAVSKDFLSKDISSLDKLPWRLLDAIDEGKIKTYDSTLKEISRAEVEARITEDMRSVISLTREEYDIMWANGDYSIGETLVPQQSPQQLKAIFERGGHIDSLIVTQYGLPFETKVCDFELVEKVNLDTTLRSQKGIPEYIRLIVPKEYTKSGQREILCQVKYEDFKKLGIPEQKVIDEHAFEVMTIQGDLTVNNGKTIQRLSSLKDPVDETIKHDQIKNSVFKYFGKNLMVIDSMGLEVLIKPIDY